MYYGRIGKLTEHFFQYNRPYSEQLPNFPTAHSSHNIINMDMYYKQQQTTTIPEYQQQYFQQTLHNIQVPPTNNCEPFTINTEKRNSEVTQNVNLTAPIQDTAEYLDNYLLFRK